MSLADLNGTVRVGDDHCSDHIDEESALHDTRYAVQCRLGECEIIDPFLEFTVVDQVSALGHVGFVAFILRTGSQPCLFSP